MCRGAGGCGPLVGCGRGGDKGGGHLNARGGVT